MWGWGELCTKTTDGLGAEDKGSKLLRHRRYLLLCSHFRQLIDVHLSSCRATEYVARVQRGDLLEADGTFKNFDLG